MLNLQIPKLILVIVLVTATNIATADVESVKADLLACIYKNVATEKLKTNPNATKIENMCRTQIEALVNELPIEMSMDVRELIRHDIENELD